MRLAARPAEPVCTEDIVRRAVWLARGHPGQSVSVAGPDRLEATIALCRAGFDQVTCARQTTGVAEASDLLLVVGRLSRDGLADVLARTGRLLRGGGALVVQLAHPSDDAVARAALAVGWLAAHTLDR